MSTTVEPRLGDRVRWLHDFNAVQIACDTGTVTALHMQFAGTSLERRVATVRFDTGVFKSTYIEQVHELKVSINKLEIIEAGRYTV